MGTHSASRPGRKRSHRPSSAIDTGVRWVRFDGGGRHLMKKQRAEDAEEADRVDGEAARDADDDEECAAERRADHLGQVHTGGVEGDARL